MPDNLRAELDAAARKRGRNVSEELLARLRASFARESEHQRDPALRALGFLISEVASYSQPPIPTPNWHKNPFWFRAFKLGVIELLDALEPQGEVRRPKDATQETADAHANIAVNIVLHHLRGGWGAREEAERESRREIPDLMWDEYELDQHRYARVRNDLHLMPRQIRGH